jgi:heptose I phosphotransferase
MEEQKFKELSSDLFVDEQRLDDFRDAGLDSMQGIFSYSRGDELVKENIGKYRSRTMFDIAGKTYFLKRYNNVPRSKQIANWIDHCQKKSTSSFDRGPVDIFKKAGINTPKVAAFGAEWENGFEKRSFIITEKIENADALERKLPACFTDPASAENHKKRCEFINRLADFAKCFHDSGLRHRDFYLAHIFLTESDELFLIDLQRVFRPRLLAPRYRVKDIAQLHYSAPGDIISCADRLRFLKRYIGREKLTAADRWFIRKVKAKAWRMADHDIKHGRVVPFAK